MKDGNGSQSRILERSSFSLRKLPDAKRFEVWKDSVNCIYDVNTDGATRKEGFGADLNSWRHNDLLMIDAKSVLQSFSRTSQMIAKDGMDHYNVQLYTDGTVISDRGVGGDRAKPGGLLVLDLSQPTEAQSSQNFRSLNLYLPRRLVEDKLNRPEDHNLRFLSDNDPMVKMLHDQIRSLHQHIGQLDDAEIITLQQTISMMLSTCLNAADHETGANRGMRRDIDRLVMIRRYLRKNVLSPDFSVNKAAADLGVSRSNLYRFFSNRGSVSQYIRTMRLKHGLKVLSDPSQRSRSIYDVALECGYESDTGFIRAFRTHYQITPGDVRAGYSPRQQNPTKTQFDTSYENWLHRLG
ncbi:helix-turn-helix domain-containing protein [Thalassospira sp. MA62]|nr:helix-turn-helix domain-containing protein [Thalassospira sp. MA62]